MNNADKITKWLREISNEIKYFPESVAFEFVPSLANPVFLHRNDFSDGRYRVILDERWETLVDKITEKRR